MHELRAQNEPERDTLAAAQADAASELFSAAAAERGVSDRDAAARLIASSLLDDDALVQVAAAAAAQLRGQVFATDVERLDRDRRENVLGCPNRTPPKGTTDVKSPGT
jgi:hypothetical protein